MKQVTDITAIPYTYMCQEAILKLGMPRTKIYVHLTALLEHVPLFLSQVRSPDILVSTKSLTNCLGRFGSIGV